MTASEVDELFLDALAQRQREQQQQIFRSVGDVSFVDDLAEAYAEQRALEKADAEQRARTKAYVEKFARPVVQYDDSKAHLFKHSWNGVAVDGVGGSFSTGGISF